MDHILYTYAVLPKLSFRDLGLLLRPDMFCNASSFQSCMVAIQLWSPKDSWWLIVYTSVNRWNACVNAAVMGESVTFLSPSWTQMTLIGALVCFGYSFSIVLMHWHMQQQVYMYEKAAIIHFEDFGLTVCFPIIFPNISTTLSKIIKLYDC